MDKYIAIFNLAFTYNLKNYKALAGLSIFLITCLLIFDYLWEIVASSDLTPDQLLWYTAFNQWLLVALRDTQDDIEQDLRSGRLAYLLPRPISYLGSIFSEGLGILCANLLVLGIVTFSFAWIKVGDVPLSPSAFLVAILMGLLAGCVGLIFQMLIGITAFWLQRVEPFHWVWDKLLFALGGLMLPLTIYPEWLQKIAYLTPFPAILGERSSLAFHFNLHHVLSITSTLLLWGLLGAACLIFLYRKGLRIVHIEGG